MSHRALDGTLAVARLSRSILGGTVYKDVTIRLAGGREERLGTLMVLDDMRPFMVPGTAGRFYVYDVGGSKGLHGFRAPNGDGHIGFPLRWERMMGMAGALNLFMAAFYLLVDGEFAYWSSFFGVFGIVLAIVFFSVRRSSEAAFAADGRRSAGPAPRTRGPCPVG
jgi:hypothetical protein